MHEKLFKGKIDLAHRDTHRDLDARLTEVLRDLAPVNVSWCVLWTPGVTAALVGLQVREAGGAWRNVIDTMQSDLDGEITVPVGPFASGTTLELAWAVTAISAEIPKAAAYAIFDAKGVHKLAPKKPDAFQKIARTEVWEGLEKCLVRAEVVA